MNLNHFSTGLVGEVSDKHGAMSTPITNSAAFSFGSCEEAIKRFSGDLTNPQYARLGNPTNQKLEKVISDIEGGVGAFAVSSGMSAITMAVLSLCKSGDEVISMGGLFGGTYSFLHNFCSRYGIVPRFFSSDDFEGLEGAISDKTKIIFCESIGNPNLRLTDLNRLITIANDHKIACVVDNTVTPLSIKPLALGADIVVYSTTKLISGNASALGGMTIFRAVKETGDKFHTPRYAGVLSSYLENFPKETLFRAGRAILRDLGFSGHAMSSYLTLLGLETLSLRLERIKSNAIAVAKALYDEGLQVRHPSLDNHEDRALYTSLYNGFVGSLMTLDFASAQKAFDFLDNSKLVSITANIGDSRTLGLHMASTIYREYGEEARAFLGITPALVRISIGLEEPQDIIDDFIKASKNG